MSYTVGNKDDDPDRKVVEREDAMKFAEQMGIQVFETSAKDNKNVEEVCTWKVWKSLMWNSLRTYLPGLFIHYFDVYEVTDHFWICE